MKNLIVLWFSVFALSAISIGYTYDFLISPIWVVNVFTSYYLIKFRKIINSQIFNFIFAFSAVFTASALIDPVKDLEIKALLCALGAVQVVIFNYLYYFVKLRTQQLKYYHTIVLAVPSVVSALIGGLLFMLIFKFGQNYYEFLDYFLEQFSTGLGVICILFGIQAWKRISFQDYALVCLALLAQYFISIDHIFYACFILPFLMCYFALKHGLREFCLLIGLLTLICTTYVSMPLAGEYWSEAQVYMLSRISAYRLALGSYLIIFLIVCEIYLTNKRLYEAYERMMLSDELTGLKNRRFVREKVLTDPSYRNGFLLLLDIDDFKRVNDAHGHHIGDLVIQHISALLRESHVSSKMISRWGGEEFLVAVKHGSDVDCKALCDRIMKRCREKPFVYKDIQFPVNVSMGAATFEQFDLNNYETLIQKVDKNLYEAKARGKNQYVFSA